MEKYGISKKQVISRTLKEVFSFFEKPENLSVITPKNLEFDILTPKPIKMDRGTVIDYTINLFCIPVHWRTLITEYCPPYKFVDVQIKGPFILWHHTHIFKFRKEVIVKLFHSVQNDEKFVPEIRGISP